MTKKDLSLMNSIDRVSYLRSLPLDELLKYAGGRKRNMQDGPAWLGLPDDRCHICHREIKNPESLSIKIGSSDCRPHIEKEMGIDLSSEHLSKKDLQLIWTRYNLYGIYVDGILCQIKSEFQKKDVYYFTLNKTQKMLIISDDGPEILPRYVCRYLWESS